MTSKIQRTVGWLSILLGVVALVVAILRSQAAGSEAVTNHFQRSFAIAQNGTLHVDNYKGTIHVSAGEGDQVLVDVTKRFEGASDSDRKWWMENTQVNFHNDNDRVSVEVKYPQWNCMFCWQGHDFTAEVDLEIHVPKQINVKLDSYKPDIKLAGVQGDVEVKSYKSPITVDSTTGSIRINTYKDTVKLQNVTLRGPLEVKSYKADTEISARALGDSVTVEDYKGSTVLRLPQSAGLNLDYEGGRHASFHSGFPLSSTAGSFNSSFHGTINGGGTRVHLRTEKGSVSLEKFSGQL